jgi:hypothetical protein
VRYTVGAPYNGNQKNYGKNTMLKPLLTMLGVILVGALVLLGIGGFAYQLFRDGGLIAQGLGALWEAQYQAPVMTIILIIAAIFVFRTLYKGQIGDKSKSRIPDFVLFAFIASGVYFLGRLVTLGHL